MAALRDLLDALDFGQVDSESEHNLDEKFIRTRDFEKFVGSSRIDLVLGPKGAGKTALFQLFDRHEDTVRRWASAQLHDVIISASNGMRDLSSLAGTDLTQVLLSPDLDFERLWTAYIGWKAAEAAAKGGLRGSGELRRFQKAIGARADRRVLSLLRRGWHATMSDSFPGSLKLSLFGHGLEVGAGEKRQWDMSKILSAADAAAERARKRVWLLLDNLDELLSANRARRIEALNALFTVCNQLRASYPRIQPRIFLRTDIWDDLAFNNKSHWVDKRLILTWSDDQLLRLLIKRAVAINAVRVYLASVMPKLTSPQAVDDMSLGELSGAFYVLFEPFVYPKDTPPKGETWRWMVQHIEDGHGHAVPRDIITFGNTARDRQREGRNDVDGPLISGEAVRYAHGDVSRIRCETYLAEFPHLRSHFLRFQTQTTARFHRTQLERLMENLTPAGNAMIDALCEVGVIKPLDGHREAAREFEIPPLYRPGLKLRLRGRA